LIKTTSAASQANAAASTSTTARSRPVTTPVAVQAAAATPSLPAGLIGNFADQFAGPDEGTFDAVVGSNGVISGSGYSSKYRSGFVASGLVTASGEMQMSGAGQAGGLQVHCGRWGQLRFAQGKRA
jgi:hypothetical protein